MKRHHRVFANLVLFCAGTLLSAGLLLFGIEVVLRFGNWVDSASPYQPRTVIRHHTGEFDATYRYNDRGFRDNRDFAQLEQPTEPRPFTVVAIGDSFTEGFGVPETETWAAGLEKIMRRKIPSSRVLNLGVSGSGPNEYENVFAYALTLEPDVIIVGFYAGNDATEAHQPRAPTPSLAVRWLAAKLRAAQRRLNPDPFQGGPLARMYRWKLCRETHLTTKEFALRHARLPANIRRALAAQTINFHLPLLAILNPDTISANLNLSNVRSREGIGFAFDIFARMRDSASAKGAAVVIATIPASVQVSPHYNKELAGMGFTGLDALAEIVPLQLSAASRAQELHLQYIDLTTALSDTNRDTYYFPLDTHLTPAGHYRVSEELAAKIEFTMIESYHR